MFDRNFSAILRKAINAGDHKSVQRLVKGGVDVNGRFWYDSTLLHEAVSVSSVDLVEMLVRAGADVNNTNKDGRTALHLACRGGHTDIVQILISAGTNVDKRSQDGKTCLHVAVWKGHADVVDMLLKAGANVNIPDSEGCTPLYWAARCNYLPILKILVGAGAKVNYRVKSKWTPLHEAVHLGYMDVVRYLLLQGVETNIKVNNKTVVSLLMDNSRLTQDVREKTLEMLVQAGFNLHKDSWTPSLSHVSSKTSCVVPQGSPPDEIMAKWLDRKKEVLPTLTNLCRTRVRKRLSYCNKGRSIVDIIPRLPLPSILLDFISFKDDLWHGKDEL